MKVFVERFKEFDDCTKSYVTVKNDKDESVYKCYGLEPKGPDSKQANINRRIPQGEYHAIWKPSQRAGNDICGKLPLIYNDVVPESRKIRIHIGNYPKDTFGCLLLGEQTGSKSAISYSRVALTNFIKAVGQNEFDIFYINSF